ncbi:MAG: glutamate--tRNA ligase [Phycisphaeraceae bacterium]|nr:MAG: glutamate--tRNA ligase [Phycisphaeraceae bacterium]
MPGTPVTRFAPSPTGHLHIGGARTALFCWAFARRNKGRFMIRVEDTDAARSSEESARGILADLAWLGIDNDLGPYLDDLGEIKERDWPDGRVRTFFQSRRTTIYDQHIERLVRAGRAYPAFESAEEIEAQRKAAVARKATYRYPRPADVTPGEFNDALASRWERACSGARHVIRFAAPAEPLVVLDEILGEVAIAAGELDDFVIRKADGLPTYHFAVVVDDELMGVTHVLRAQEHLANTPRHVALQSAMGFRTPVYAHMPIIFNPDGTKMSKRDKAKAARKAAKDAVAKGAPPHRLAADCGIAPGDLDAFLAGDNDNTQTAEHLARGMGVALPEIEVWDFRRNGYLPGAIINFLSLLGWNPGMKQPDGKDLEKFDAAFLCAHFSLDRVGKTPSKFDRAKLLSFNADAIAAMTDEGFAQTWLAWMKEHEPAAHATIAALGVDQRLALAQALRPRAKTLRDALRPAAFALVGDADYPFDPAAADKHLRAEGGKGLAVLREFRAVLADAHEWTPEALTRTIDAFAKQRGMPNPGPVAQPLRVALTGTGVSPGLGETLAVLGKASALTRVDRCLREIGG